MRPPFNSFQPQARPHQQQHQHQQHQQQQNNGYPGYQQHNGYQNPGLMMSNPMMAAGHMNNMVPVPNMNPQFFNNMPQQQQQFPQFGLQNNINQLLNLMAQSLPLQPNFFQPPPSAFPPQPPQPPPFNSFNPPRPYLPVPTPLQNHQPPPGFSQPRPQLPQGQSVETPNNNNNGFRNNYTKQQKFNGQGQGFHRPHLHQTDNAKKKFGSKKDHKGKGKNNKKAPGLDGSDATEKKRPLAISYTKKEVRQWREARRKNFPTGLNVEKSLKKTVSGCVLDKEARMRRKQIQEVLAKQAELGVEVAEVPSHYLSNTDEQVNGDRGGRFQNNRNHKRRHGGKDRFSKKPRVQNESSSQESSITAREPSLLEKLLSTDIKREKSQLLQVFRFMVINSFFKELPDQPLKLPLVMVEETGCEHDREDQFDDDDDVYVNGDDDSCDVAVD
uniref:FMR1-interacting protein 1 conserved domain-containing protein n=1 Tax=Noccaea caerulescens TaxID=107243 RepID=A0A1J3CLH6_NOCCA